MSTHSARIADYFRLVRFSHSVFALPFALISLWVATAGQPPLRLLILVVLAAVAARTAAMAYNRYVDRGIDARNPRTAQREIPRGVIAPGQALALTLLAAGSFVALAFAIRPLCGWLAFPVLAVLLGYSHAKRFTSAVHAWLGLALALAVPAAWIAARGWQELAPPLVLGLGVWLWVAGFDLIYACQDEAFDRSAGLYSVPARFGAATAFRCAAVAHAAAFAALLGFAWLAGLGWIFRVGVLAAGALLFWQHRLVAPDNLRRIDQAFFTSNAWVGLGLLASTVLDGYF